MALLLTAADLPADFTYPRAFIRVVELGLTDLEPWEIVDGDALSRRFAGRPRGGSDESGATSTISTPGSVRLSKT